MVLMMKHLSGEKQKKLPLRPSENFWFSKFSKKTSGLIDACLQQKNKN